MLSKRFEINKFFSHENLSTEFLDELYLTASHNYCLDSPIKNAPAAQSQHLSYWVELAKTRSSRELESGHTPNRNI